MKKKQHFTIYNILSTHKSENLITFFLICFTMTLGNQPGLMKTQHATVTLPSSWTARQKLAFKLLNTSELPRYHMHYKFFFFFFEVHWIQGLYPELLHQPFFCEGCFWDRVSGTICPSWLRTMILLSSHIIGVSHQHAALNSYFRCSNVIRYIFPFILRIKCDIQWHEYFGIHNLLFTKWSN
jgi:hypothetical protein